MYLPSNTPILQDQRQSAANKAACSDARVRDMRVTSAEGRVALFNTLVSPNQVAQTSGMGTAIDAAKLQAQTRVSRATGLLGTGSQSSGGESVAEIMAGAPEVVSLNRGGGCATYSPVPLGDDPTPGMPQRAPEIVDGPDGPMYYRGADATFPNNTPSHTGLTGYAPPWSDAYVPETPVNIGRNDMGVVSTWVMDNPWLALAIGTGAVVFFSRRSKR